MFKVSRRSTYIKILQENLNALRMRTYRPGEHMPGGPSLSNHCVNMAIPISAGPHELVLSIHGQDNPTVQVAGAVKCRQLCGAKFARVCTDGTQYGLCHLASKFMKFAYVLSP